MKHFILATLILFSISNYSASDANESLFFRKENVKYLNWGVPLTFATYGIFFWDWGKINSFKTRNEGWFGGGTYAGGTDKLAHMYSHFLINRASHSFYLKSGLSNDEASRNSFLLASSVGLMIEVGDALSHYGFSKEDLIADLAGIGLGHLLNNNSYLDELIGFQFWWWNDSDSTADHRGKKLRDPVDDYNNQKYIFNFRFAAIPYLRDFKVTRYINFDLGYYSRGFTNDSRSTDLRREIFTGFSLNLTQLIRDYFPDNGYTYTSSTFFKYYQAPYTGFEATRWTDHD